MTEEKQNEQFDETNDQTQSVATEEVEVNETEENVEEVEQDKVVEIPEAELEQLKQKANEEEEKYLRLYAEFENYKRRMKQEASIIKDYQAQRVLTDVLPALDNMDRALKQEGESEDFLTFKKGVDMVYNDLLKSLKDNGLEEIESYNQPFDPNVHQAVMQDNNPDFESGVVTEELQRGYKLKDRVLRPAMVKVNE
ncbi:nucleotide exchange factor GrpE [Mammaliicoccus sciuri]|uniref:nucleotide exchange factor GrpE n=1 Tax=Mammaliicoccus sciuri TaxID=1296 RepID=UPI001950DB7C|nr:nucleotide exchange factor GrpE [Mammaliicoccus sciuri]MCD8835387.1 nucleotide exchange factor GrpE [Mammaliicoccus sciuri]MCJ0939662.1 nucleotide exchange factor GrpE [Mammaliicoccus sciuri]MCJ1763473.1 nucleotide exchange factor GrpE [Mammaliicoccus sciuri]MCJ1772256.1 nucleotide exchange factor GrpE [Mammaliicoccus sciuri]MEB6225911.1 nucleotide exchange factor GrpE [Mammaliicoccus sciuri]